MPWEDGYLKANYWKETMSGIQVQLPNRSDSAIRSRASQLGLSRHSRLQLTKPISEKEAAWLACALDAEGSISLNNFRNSKTGKANLVPVLRVSNTSLEFVEQVKKFAGVGRVAEHYRRVQMTPSGLRPCRQVYDFTLNGRFIVGKLLEILLPYLIIKRKKAMLMIEAGQLYGKRHVTRNVDYERIEMLWRQLQQMGYGRGKLPYHHADIVQLRYNLGVV